MRWMLGHSSLHGCLGHNDAAKRVPDGYSSTPRRDFCNHRYATRIDRAAPPPFLQPSSHNSTKRKPIAPEALETAAGPARRCSRWHAACDGKTEGADDIGVEAATFPGRL